MNRKYINYFIGIMLMIAFVSGVCIHPFDKIVGIKIIHGISSMFLMLGCCIHVFQHKR